ncbi:MAG: cytochrome C [Pseudomonadota bacterium]|jgi:hypothetical protein
MTEEKGLFERGLWRNPMSYMGLVMSGLAAFLIAVLMIVDFLAAVHSAYLGVLLFFILPVVFMAGFVLLLWGMWDEHKRRRKTADAEIPRFPILDLNKGSHRIKFIVFNIGAALGALLLTVIAYEAYHFTESLTFCGELCHEVMEPEAVASQNSPHARVSCAGCHVGPGAGWYVKSKLSGARQVLAVLLDSYPRPIPPAIQHLRPARETCEECHWPEKFYGSKLKVHTHFGYDEYNIPHDVSMLVRIGGGESRAEGGGSGIHWHMLADKEVTFKAADATQQVIPVVWEKMSDGRVVEYRLQGYEEEENVENEGHESEERLVDCVVCHNRPTHIYKSPDLAMDKALVDEAIDPKLPYIKKLGVELLTEEYSSHEDAATKIRDAVWEFYRSEYPGKEDELGPSIFQAAEVLIDIYRNNFFPEMKVSWKEYPDNVGHWIFPGCFRCHDGKHVSEDGRTIRRDCEICHTMPESAPSTHWAEAIPEGKDWGSWHPWDLKYQHAEMNCNVCHDGGLPPALDCATCHEQKGVSEYDENVGMGEFDCSECHLDDQKVQPVMDCLDCHEGELEGLHTEVEDHMDAGCLECHKPHTWAVKDRETCYECHDDKEDHNPEDVCTDCHDFT